MRALRAARQRRMEPCDRGHEQNTVVQAGAGRTMDPPHGVRLRRPADDRETCTRRLRASTATRRQPRIAAARGRASATRSFNPGRARSPPHSPRVAWRTSRQYHRAEPAARPPALISTDTGRSTQTHCSDSTAPLFSLVSDGAIPRGQPRSGTYPTRRPPNRWMSLCGSPHVGTGVCPMARSGPAGQAWTDSKEDT